MNSKPHAHMCCGGEDLPTAANPIIEPGVSWKHSEVIASLRTVPANEMQSRRKSVHNNHSNSVLYQTETVTAVGLLKKSPNRHHHQDHQLSPGFAREHHSQNLPTSNCSSALLERTGSDLSISSLPSSSSVAEVGYISRSVLTDESDIDSETERSLESNSKSGSKQGIRSLVACFIANSLRLKKPGGSDKEKNNKDHVGDLGKAGRGAAGHGVHGVHGGGKRVKKKTSRSEKDKCRSKQHRPLGLSSTDGSSYADIPSSALNHSQPLPSLSLDASRHANFSEPISRPAVLFSSPKYASSSAAAVVVLATTSCASTSNHVRSVKSSSRSSPFRSFPGQHQHHIDGHISEEVTNSSHSSNAAHRQRMSSADRADSSDRTRPSTNASSENASSPRRRRNKGPAPKPPMTQCSSSPLSTTNNATSTSCPSSVPASPSNSSIVTSHSASSKSHVVLTSKSPAPLPPHLTRSLSEQKQLNMKNLINATHTFRSEVNLMQDAQSAAQSDPEHTLPDELLQLRADNEENIVLVCEEGYSTKLAEKRSKQKAAAATANDAHHHHHHHHSRKAVTIKEDETIYETPLPIKSLLADSELPLPPDLPCKTFDPLKMFGCKYNEETRRLERVYETSDGSPSNMPRSLSLPVSQFTCCLHHWKEYLNALAQTDPVMVACNHQKDNENSNNSNLKQLPEETVKLGTTTAYEVHPFSSITHECDCEHYHECLPSSDLMNALLSPQHSLRYKKSKHEYASKKHTLSPEHSVRTADLGAPFSSFERCEFIRALSDGSLTNTSTATVVEFINEDSSNGADGEPLPKVVSGANIGPSNGALKQANSSGAELLGRNEKCLSDVFCQTTFEDAPERPARRYKNHKYSCRCRHLKSARAHQGQNRGHCRHRHCAHHNECCSTATPAAAYFGGDDMNRGSNCRNVWLTSSTSDHSLSSSTSTLSEASTMRTSSTLSNDVAHCKAAAVGHHLCSTSSTISPFGEPLVRFPGDNDGGFYSSNTDTLAELLSGRSPISTERLFKSAQNNFPPPLVSEAESSSEFITSAFDQVQVKSSSTPLASIFQELGADMYLSKCAISLLSSLLDIGNITIFLSLVPTTDTSPSISCKSNNEETQNKCLMTELEMAIACGNHQRAAILAKELAIKRAHCSLTNKQYCSGSNMKEKPARTSPIVYVYFQNFHPLVYSFALFTFYILPF